MKVEVLLFAQLKEMVGRDRLLIELSEGQTAKDVVGVLIERSSNESIVSLPLSFAVNEEIVAEDHPLRDGDRVAVLTPVSGG
jgi:molybdopterin synthase sulfur carrier subunit